jgi:hypothetical protein
VNFGNWNLYTGTISVAPGAVVAAQAVPASPLYTSSAPVDQTYTALPAGLIPPVITPSAPEFGLFTNRDVTVTIVNQNSPSISKIEYRIGGDPWQVYAGPFTLNRNAYPSGSLVQARAVPIDPYYVASTATLRTLGVETANLAGVSVGSFSNPVGEQNMETNLVNGLESDYFEWGKVNGGNADFSKSWLNYDGMSIANIALGQRFEIGRLDYYNGTILNNTGATEVSFNVDLGLNLNEFATQSLFSFNLELINTENKGDDDWADADFVRLSNQVASKIVSFNGLQFQLQLEFGESTSSGISYFNEFHVIENREASTKLYGTLIEVGTVTFNK